MAYNIYLGDTLSAVAKDEMSCVMRCNAYHKQGHVNLAAYEVMLDGSEKPYEWWKAYNKLCY
jgi:hypothetical protein